MRTFTLIACIFLHAYCPYAQSAKDFPAFREQFIRDYQALELPQFVLSYADNLQHIQSAYNIQQQLDFFNDADKKIKLFESFWITDEERADLDLMRFETKLNLQRLALEKRWSKEKPAVISNNDLYNIPHGNEWYAYFLNRWVGAFVNPDELYFNGIEEVERVKEKIEAIRLRTGLPAGQFFAHLKDTDFYTTDEALLLQLFEQIKNVIQQNLSVLFNLRDVGNVNISRGINVALAQTPGYYDANTFYYNLSNVPYCKRQVSWLFIHEALPGHHYQSSIAAQTAQSKVQQLFYYPGFAEGWAAYAETLGKSLGAYRTDYDELGCLEWDLVRSVRVIIDIGLNYYGWTDKKALAAWKEYISGQDEIAIREINRMRQWPAQVVTYKYGAELILRWKKELQEKQGDAFDIKDFHDRILNHGPLPFSVVRKNVFKKTTLVTGQ